MVAPELKDEFLKSLCDECPIENHVSVKLPVVLERFKIDFKTLQMMLIEFRDLELISDLNIRQVSNVFHVTISYRAKNFIDSGGFVFMQKIAALAVGKLTLDVEKLTLEIQLLYAEIDNLSHSNPTVAERLFAIVSNIATIAGVAGAFVK